MSGSQSRRGAPKQVNYYTFEDDPTGFRRLPQTQGMWKPIAYLGFIVMTVGLGIFGFMLISSFGAASGGGVPKMPAGLPIGFGIALAGGLAFQLGIVLGAPKDRPFPGAPYYDISSEFIADRGSSINIGRYQPSIVINQQLNGIDDLYEAVLAQRMDKRHRSAAIERIGELSEAVEADAGEEVITNRLKRVTDVLYAAGALTGGATAVAASLLKLAGLLGDAGQGVYDWLVRQRR